MDGLRYCRVPTMHQSDPANSQHLDLLPFTLTLALTFDLPPPRLTTTPPGPLFTERRGSGGTGSTFCSSSSSSSSSS